MTGPTEGTPKAQKSYTMWAVQHVPSGSWHHGDTTLMLYHAEYTARRDCPNSAFVPVKVTVHD